jgi:hypothetical protein
VGWPGGAMPGTEGGRDGYPGGGWAASRGAATVLLAASVCHVTEGRWVFLDPSLADVVLEKHPHSVTLAVVSLMRV